MCGFSGPLVSLTHLGVPDSGSFHFHCDELKLQCLVPSWHSGQHSASAAWVRYSWVSQQEPGSGNTATSPAEENKQRMYMKGVVNTEICFSGKTSRGSLWLLPNTSDVHNMSSRCVCISFAYCGEVGKLFTDS